MKIGRPQVRDKGVIFTFRLRPSEREFIERQAEEKGLTLSDYFRKLIEEKMKENELKK